MGVTDATRFGYDVLTNVVGDLVFAIGLAVAALLVSDVLWRRALHAFFGVTRPSRSAIRVRLSCINVVPGGARATDRIAGGFVGPAMSEQEYRLALRLTRVVQRRPMVRALSALMESTRSAGTEPVVCKIGSSPPYEGEAPVEFESDAELARRLRRQLAGGTFVLIGEPMYNLLTRFVLHEAPSRFLFVGGLEPGAGPARTIQVRNAYHTPADAVDEDYERKVEDGVAIEYGVLERIVDWNGSTIFLCAGTSTASTVAAVRELVEWRDLRTRFVAGRGGRRREPGVEPLNGSFGILYEVRVADREAVPEPHEVLERWCYPPSGPSGRRR
jgi:hypothetical protein